MSSERSQSAGIGFWTAAGFAVFLAAAAYALARAVSDGGVAVAAIVFAGTGLALGLWGGPEGAKTPAEREILPPPRGARRWIAALTVVVAGLLCIPAAFNGLFIARIAFQGDTKEVVEWLVIAVLLGMAASPFVAIRIACGLRRPGPGTGTRAALGALLMCPAAVFWGVGASTLFSNDGWLVSGPAVLSALTLVGFVALLAIAMGDN